MNNFHIILKNIFHPFLSEFRPGFGCNTALLKIIEDWKKAIDCNQYTAAVSIVTNLQLAVLFFGG
jgi:hypothetical protein